MDKLSSDVKELEMTYGLSNPESVVDQWIAHWNVGTPKDDIAVSMLPLV